MPSVSWECAGSWAGRCCGGCSSIPSILSRPPGSADSPAAPGLPETMYSWLTLTFCGRGTRWHHAGHPVTASGSAVACPRSKFAGELAPLTFNLTLNTHFACHSTLEVLGSKLFRKFGPLRPSRESRGPAEARYHSRWASRTCFLHAAACSRPWDVVPWPRPPPLSDSAHPAAVFGTKITV